MAELSHVFCRACLLRPARKVTHAMHATSISLGASSLQIDAHTVEVADYTVVIKGLPEVDPIEASKSCSCHQPSVAAV
jgi:hypothetical protein